MAYYLDCERDFGKLGIRPCQQNDVFCFATVQQQYISNMVTERELL